MTSEILLHIFDAIITELNILKIIISYDCYEHIVGLDQRYEILFR